MIKLLIADDHQIVIDGLKALLRTVERVEVVGEANDGAQAVRKARALQPDLVLMDIEMPVVNGIEASARLKEQFPNIRILICTTHSDAYKIKKGLQAGVDGYLLKGSGREELLRAIDEIMRGNTYYDEKVVGVIMDNFNKKRSPQPVELTKREKEIVQLIADGLNTKEIAQRLFLSPLTVETHRKNIFSKLGINKVAALIRYALKQGLIE
jgi:DNA-binding NarL/FixJ family response regulator